MATAKYRPTLTMDEITCIIEALEEKESRWNPPSLEVYANSALRNLKMFKFKSEMGVNQPASISTGRKPGPTSARDILLADEPPKPMSLEQAKVAAEMYKNLGVEVPSDITTIINEEV
jgi:hypothetical protein